MKNRVLQLAFALGLTFIVAATLAGAAAPERVALIQRGRYIVENVGMCIDCHSPRNEKGEFIPERGLTGAPIASVPTVPMPWAPVAPRIAGLPATMNEEQVAQFLQTGRRPDGSSPRPPMPPYRFNQDDANAVAAYLKSLAK